MIRASAKILFGLFLLILPGVVSATIHNISIVNFDFTPKNTIVILGDTVRWTVSSGTHTTTSDPSSPKTWGSGNLGVGAHFDLIVLATDSTGNYPYHCAIHSLSMFDTLRVSAPAPPCCVPPIRGDANGNNAVNVIDLNFLVAYFFSGGPTPPCNQEADVNGNGALNVLDLNALVAYFFSGGPAPAACP